MASNDQDFLPFVRLGEKDLLPNTPLLSVTIQAAIELSVTLPYPIRFTIRRLAKVDGTDNQPCIIRWSPAADAFSPHSGLVLLRHSSRNGGGGDLEPIPVDHSSCDNTTSGEDGVVVPGNGDSQFLWELPAPGSEVTLTATLPERYYRAITQAGASWRVYTLLFPGAELGVWDWGTLQEHEDSGRGLGEGRGGAKLVVPGGARIHFTAVRFSERRWPERDAYEAEHGFERANVAQKEWHDREERKAMADRIHGLTPPVELSERVSGAPHFTVAVEGPTTVKSYERIRVSLAFTYHGVTGPDGKLQTSPARPVTFHSWVFGGSNDSINSFNIHLARRRGGPEAAWEDCALWESGVTGWAIYDEPDIEVQVGQRGNGFASLRPAESWSIWESLNDLSDVALPRDSMPGDVFRCWVGRCEVDWWDWGSMEDHRETTVKLPCWVKGEVTEPKDNEGRPRLVVPASEWFEFTLIE